MGRSDLFRKTMLSLFPDNDGEMSDDYAFSKRKNREVKK